MKGNTLPNTNEQLQRELAESKKLEQELLDLSSRQEAILAAVPELIMEVDNHNIYTWANQTGFAFFGDDVIGQNLHDLIALVRFRPAYHTAFRKFQQTGQGSAVGKILDLEALRKDGQEISVQLSLSAVQTNDGWHALGLIRDITERKRGEDLLREKERLLSESQRLGHIGSFFSELSGPMQWSDELYRLHGVSPETFTPSLESLLELIHPDDRQSMQDLFAASAAGEKSSALEFRINRPDGTMRYVRALGEVVLDSENRPIYMAGTVQDITESKLAEEESLRYSAELEKKNKELLDALANVKQLTGMLPICASCKKIRDDKGYWSAVESYIGKHSEAEFSHGLCPECEKKAYEDLKKLLKEDT